MIARIALLTVAVLAVLAGPAKGRGFERVGSTAHQPFSDGTALVWQATGAALELRRPATGQRRRIAVPSGCRLADVATSRHALVSCGGGAAAGYVLGLRTAGRVALPRASFLTVDRIGAHWVEGYFNPGCYHCDSQVFRNWRTGEERAFDGMDAIQTDLDDPELPRLPGRIVARHRDVSVVYGERLVAVVDGQRRRLSACLYDCESFTAWNGRVSWIEGRSLSPGVLREVDLRTRRERSWPMRLAGRGADYATSVRIRSALYVGVPMSSPLGRPFPLRGRYRLLRAR